MGFFGVEIFLSLRCAAELFVVVVATLFFSTKNNIC